MPSPVLRTVATFLRHEPPKIKGSRFIASLAPVTSADEALAFVESLRVEFADATHNCFAWRLDQADGYRSSDDGEPGGTAGPPILRALEGRELVKVVAVVTRYFGGTKLGTGGLIRAYGGAVAEALDHANIVETVLTESLRLRFAYEFSSAVQATLHAFEAQSASTEYTADVLMEVVVPLGQAERLAAALIEATAGRLEVLGDV